MINNTYILIILGLFMRRLMPQEIEVWYLIPALRRELALLFIKKHGLNQRKSAEILGITEAAISQYTSSKRANDIKFTKKELELIKKVAKNILDNPNSLMEGLYGLCVLFRSSKVMCDLHRNKDKSVSKECDICLEKG